MVLHVVQLLDYELQKGKNLINGRKWKIELAEIKCACSLYWQMERKFQQGQAAQNPK